MWCHQYKILIKIMNTVRNHNDQLLFCEIELGNCKVTKTYYVHSYSVTKIEVTVL